MDSSTNSISMKDYYSELKLNSSLNRLLTNVKIALFVSLLPLASFAQPSIFMEDFEGGTLGPFTNSNVQMTLQWVNTNIRGGDAGHSPTQAAYFGNPADTSFNTGFTEGAEMSLRYLILSEKRWQYLSLKSRVLENMYLNLEPKELGMQLVSTWYV